MRTVIDVVELSPGTWRRWPARLAAAVLTVDDNPAGMVSATAPPRLTWAHAEQGGAPVVLSVKTPNEPAIQLYQRHGFTDAGPSPDDPSERLMRL